MQCVCTCFILFRKLSCDIFIRSEYSLNNIMRFGGFSLQAKPKVPLNYKVMAASPLNLQLWTKTYNLMLREMGLIQL